MSQEKRLVSCKHLSPESVSIIDEEVSDGYEEIQQNHDKKVVITVRIVLEYNHLTDEILSDCEADSTVNKKRKFRLGLVRDGKLLQQGTGLISDYEPEGSKHRERVA